MTQRKDDDNTGLRPIGDILPKPKPLSPIKRRLINGACEIQGGDPSEILFQHTVLCQTVLPYRNPGDDVRLWKRKQGLTVLELQAGSAYDGNTNDFVDVGLPFGPKPRLVLYHLNAQALRTGSREIEVEDSLTAFVKRIGLDPKGRNMRIIKEQLTRLSAADFRFGTMREGEAITVKSSIVSGFSLWVPQDPRQRVLWPTTVSFSQEYFDSLRKHAVPLNETAVAVLSHSAMALDIYTWLSQRLHRVPKGKGQFIPWTAMHDQFGRNYSRIRKFRAVFIEALKQVTAVYPEAKLDVDGRGIVLRNSLPPVRKRMLLINQK